jgi:hypothetical protein
MNGHADRVLCQLGFELFHRRAVARREMEVAPFRRQDLGQGVADTLRGPGYQSGLAGEIKLHLSLLLMDANYAFLHTQFMGAVHSFLLQD